MIEGLRTMLADVAYKDDECTKALEYLNGLFTADGAYKQAQVNFIISVKRGMQRKTTHLCFSFHRENLKNHPILCPI